MKERKPIIQEYVDGVMAYVVGGEVPNINDKSPFWKIGYDDCLEYSCVRYEGKRVGEFLEWVGNLVAEFNQINQEWSW